MNKTGKLTNPIFTSVEGQVLTESHIFSDKQDVYNFALTLICSFCFSTPEYKKHRGLLLRQATTVLETNPGISFLKEACLVYRVLQPNKRQAEIFKAFILSNLEEVPASNLSSNTKGLIGYCLFEDCFKSLKVRNYIKQLYEKGDTELHNENITTAIDYFFGCNNFSSESKSRFAESLINNAKDLTIERLAKGILILRRIEFSEESVLLTILEDKIRDDLVTWKTADIEFSLYEAQKLVNSNIPVEHLNTILGALKKVNTNWTKLIDKIETEGVYVNLKNFNKLPNFSPNNDVWALLALKESGRKYSYQLSPSSYAEYVELKREKIQRVFKVESYSVIAFIFFTIFLTFVVTLLFITRDASLPGLANQNVFSPGTPQEVLTILLNPWLESMISVFWLYLMYNKLQKKGFLNSKDLILTWPGWFLVSALITSAKEAVTKRNHESQSV